MNCNEIQTALIASPDSHDPHVRQHLADCAECRRFAAWAETLAQLPGPVPSADLDQSVLRAASLRLATLRHRRQRRFGWIAAAASLALLLGWLGLPARRAPQAPRTVAASAPREQESIWADGKLEAALRDVEEQVSVLTSGDTESGAAPVAPPSFDELDSDLLDLELRFYFEKAVLGTIESPAAG